MNLLMMYPHVDTAALKEKKILSSFDVLSQIIPPMTMVYKTKQFKGTANPITYTLKT